MTTSLPLRSVSASVALCSAAVFLAPPLLVQPVQAQSAAGWSKRGAEAEVREDYDAAFEAYRQAHLLKPNDLRYKTHFERARFSAAAAHVDRGRVLRQSGDMNGALTEFQRGLAIDGSNQAAQQEITVTRRMMEANTSTLDLPAPVGATPEIAGIAEPIHLRPVSTDPLTLHMVEDTKVIYQAIGKAAGLNVIFDPDYTSRRIQVDITAVPLEDALRILGVQSGTFYKPVTNNTIFVAQNNRQKRTDLDTMAVQTFYLSNAATQADQNELLTALRNVLSQDTKIFLVPSQNAIVMRSTPDQLLLTQELLNNLDRPHSEVVVDVAVLEVNRDKARNLGITLPQSVSVTPQVNNSTTSSSTSTTTSTTSTTTLPTLNTFYNLTGSNFGVSVGSATVNALLSDSDTRILQNPRIRATDGQRAQLKIGQRIPIATGSFSSGASTAIVSSLVNTQFTYTDVGVSIDMTPTVHQDREITLKLGLEISTVNSYVTISSVQQPVIGQRKIEQIIQLKEGEPSILAGLLTRQETNTLTGTPGLSDIPILNKIFSSNQRNRSTSEVVFLLIPHIVREPLITRLNTRAIDTGTGNAIELRHDAMPAVAPATDNSASVTTGAFQAQQRAAGQPITAAQAAAAMIGQVGNETSPAAQRAQAALNNPAAAMLPQATPAGGAPISFSVTPPSANQATGSTFQMSVVASGAKDLYSVPLQVQFDPALLSLVNVDSGELLGRDGQAVAVVHRDEGNGLVTISVSRPPAVRGVDGEGSVAVLTFKANAPGDARVALSRVGAKDSSQTNLPAVGSQATVHIR